MAWAFGAVFAIIAAGCARAFVQAVLYGSHPPSEFLGIRTSRIWNVMQWVPFAVAVLAGILGGGTAKGRLCLVLAVGTEANAIAAAEWPADIVIYLALVASAYLLPAILLKPVRLARAKQPAESVQ